MRVEDIDRNVAERSRGRDGERVRHVLRQASRGARERRQTLGMGDGGRGTGGFGPDGLVPRPPSLVPENVGTSGLDDRKLRELTVIEEVPPILPHRLRVAQVLLVHHLHERRVVGTKDELAHEGKSNAAYIVCYETLRAARRGVRRRARGTRLSGPAQPRRSAHRPGTGARRGALLQSPRDSRLPPV